MGILESIRRDADATASPAKGEARAAVVARIDSNPILGVLLVLLNAVSVVTLVAGPGGDAGAASDSGREAVFALFVLATAVFHLSIGHREHVFRHNRRLFVVFGLMLLQIALVRLAVWTTEVMGLGHAALITPLALGPVVLCVLLGHRMGIFAALYGSLLGSLVVPVEDRFLFVIMGLGCGLVGIASTLRVRRRSRLIQAGLYVGVAHLAIALAFGVTAPLEADLASTDWVRLFTHIVAILAVELGTVILLSGLLPIFEGLADVTTDISWIEMSDLNHPLLKRMTIEAPGTYHHSLMVATLSEAAAESIGANPTQARVCSTFHDIGKLENPGFYIENQGGGPNPHDELTPAMSARKIIAHVKDGVSLAAKHKLNRQISAVIREHHGDSLVVYFFHKAEDLRARQLEEVKQGMRTEEDVSEVDEAEFRYPGPRPRSRESAIISLADAVESASRTLTDHEDDTVREMISQIIRARVDDGQLSSAPITLSELAKVEQAFATTLKSLLHARVPYPVEREAEAGGARQVTSVAEPATGESQRAAEDKAGRPPGETQPPSRGKPTAEGSPGEERGEPDNAQLARHGAS